MICATRGVTHLDQVALEPHRLELDALVLHVDVEVSVARADGAIALDDPALRVVQRRRESHCIAHKTAVAGC